MDAYSAYLKMFLDKQGKPLTNADFNEARLNQARQAVYNKMFEDNNIPGYYAKLDNYNSNPNIKERDKINKASNAVGYGNYPKGSDMPNILGRFYFTKDKNGNILVSDTYDFNKYNADKIDPRYLPMIAGRKFGTPYNINLNLGNPKDWNMKYTGNNQIDLGWN